MCPTHPWKEGQARNLALAPVLPCLVGPNVLLSPTRHWAEAEPSTVAETALQGKLRPFQQINKEGASSTGVTSLGRRGQGTSEWPLRHNTQTSLPHAHPQPYFIPPSPDSWVKTSRFIPALWSEEKESGTKKGSSCLLRSLVGPGPQGSHHRRLKTRLTVKMMPRRRMKGSQVFTKAPTLTGEWVGRAGEWMLSPRAPSIQT